MDKPKRGEHVWLHGFSSESKVVELFSDDGDGVFTVLLSGGGKCKVRKEEPPGLSWRAILVHGKIGHGVDDYLIKD